MAKKPIYPLKALYELKEEAEKKAQENYYQQQQKVLQAKKQLSVMEEQLKVMKEEREHKKRLYFEQALTHSSSAEKVKNNDLHIKALLQKEENWIQKIDKQKELIKILEKELKEKLIILSKASQELKALQKHHEKWLLTEKRILERKEEEISEEIAQAQYLKNKH